MSNASQAAYIVLVSESNSDPCQDLTQWGIFLSSLLLSLTGVLSMCMMGCRRSNCSEVQLCKGCLQIKRENLDIEV